MQREAVDQAVDLLKKHHGKESGGMPKGVSRRRNHDILDTGFPGENTNMDAAKRYIKQLDSGEKVAFGSDGRPWQIFASGPATPPPHLAGREKELQVLDDAVWNMMGKTGIGGQPILLFGPRGMGKTVLLEKFLKKPPCDADIRFTTPKTGLADIDNIPNILLSTPGSWKEKIPGRAGIKFSLPGVPGLEMGWDMGDAASAEGIKHEIIKKCAARPMVLIVDEAHTLKGDAGAFFLNYMQSIAMKGRLLLVLAGTPNLRSALIATEASFISRGRDRPLGPLNPGGARDSIEIPLGSQSPPVAIDPRALEKVVEDSHGYPFFLQTWGEELWTGRREDAPDLIDMNTLRDVRDIVQERKDELYSGYFGEISKMRHLLPAKALAEAFTARAGHLDKNDKNVGMPHNEALSIIFSMTSSSLNDTERADEAYAIFEELKARDVLWVPRKGIAQTALPSFHRFIKENASERIAALLREGADIKAVAAAPASDNAAMRPGMDRDAPGH